MERRLLALRLLGLGWYVATCVVAGALAGYFLGRHFGIPVLILPGVLLGTFVAFYGLYKMVKPLLNTGPASAPPKPGSNGENSP